MAMSKEAKKLRNEYARSWYQRNKAKIKKQREAMWERKAAKLKAEAEADQGRADQKGSEDHGNE